MPKTNTVIITPQIPVAYPNGGIATFVGHFIRLLLKEQQDRLKVIFTEPPQRPEHEWLPFYRENDIELAIVHTQIRNLPPGYLRTIRVSELASEAVPDDTDIVYLSDWRAGGIHLVRSRRFQEGLRPSIVTILHGSSEWHRQGMKLCPTSYEELGEDYLERYVAQHSDFVISPSKYASSWCLENEWVLPPPDRTRVLGYPYMGSEEPADNVPESASRYRNLIFFGRIETRKGFDLFVESLCLLRGASCAIGLEKIVLLGAEGGHDYGGVAVAARRIEEALAVEVVVVGNLDSEAAGDYLRRRRSDSLVVIPSRSETAGFTVIEASLIPGLNMICANAGGIPEVLGEHGKPQLFQPTVSSLKDALERWLERGPGRWKELARYDWSSANQRWLSFHREAASYGRCLGKSTGSPTVSGTSRKAECVDVCVSFYNLGAFLPGLLASLANQTITGFNVIVVNDGSTERESVEVFSSMKLKYESVGWHFVSTPNRGPSAARNYAASLGRGKYICFVDADNIAAPNMIERFLKGIEISGEDCLTCYLYAFEGTGSPYVNAGTSSVPILRSPCYVYLPFGKCLEAGLLQNAFGDANCIMRREVFEKIGGFGTDLEESTGTEDWELLARLCLAGYKLDVIPEFLVYYRHRTNSRSRAADPYLSEVRALRAYANRLNESGLGRVTALVMGLKHFTAQLRQLQNERDRAIQAALATGARHEVLVESVHWRVLVRALLAKWPRLYRVWRSGRNAMSS